MSDYNERMPVVSLRLEKKLLLLIDRNLSLHGTSRQKYLKNLIIEDLKSRGILEIEYKLKD